jgi:hypothetical protein
MEVPSLVEERKERVVWLGFRIVEREGGEWLRFDNEAKTFGVSPEYDIELELEMASQTPATPGQSVDYGKLPDARVAARLLGLLSDAAFSVPPSTIHASIAREMSTGSGCRPSDHGDVARFRPSMQFQSQRPA